VKKQKMSRVSKKGWNRSGHEIDAVKPTYVFNTDGSD